MPSPNDVRKDSPLRAARLQRHWSQRELAEKLGATIATVKRWERQATYPSPYFRLKLTALFGKSEYDLGFCNEEKSSTLNSPEAVEPQEELRTASDLVEYEMPEPEDVRMKISIPVFQTKQDTRKHPGRHKYVVGFLFILAFACIALLIYWPTHTFPLHAISPISRPSALPTVLSDTPSQVLYEAHWAKGLNNWSVSEHCTWSGNMGGEIITDGGNGNDLLVAPYSMSRSDYALEVSMKRIGYTHLGGDAYGLVVRNTPRTGGYIAGVGVHFLPEHFFLGMLTLSDDNGSEYVSSDLARSPAHLDTQWHTYRIEVKRSTIRFLVDGTLVAQEENSVHTQAGNVGIYIDSARIAIRSFKLFAFS